MSLKFGRVFGAIYAFFLYCCDPIVTFKIKDLI